MKNTLNLGIAVLLLTGLSACKDFQGSLSVNQPLTVKNEKGVFVTLPVGSYSTKIGSKSSTKGRVLISVPDQKDLSFAFAMPAELKNENYQGQLLIKSTDMNQNFDIYADFRLDQWTSSPYDVTRSCVYDTVRRRVCEDVLIRHEDGGGHCEVRCYDESVTIWGSYLETVQDHRVDRNARFQILNVNSRDVLAEMLSSRNVSTSQSSLGSTRCELDRVRSPDWRDIRDIRRNNGCRDIPGNGGGGNGPGHGGGGNGPGHGGGGNGPGHGGGGNGPGHGGGGNGPGHGDNPDGIIGGVVGGGGNGGNNGGGRGGR